MTAAHWKSHYNQMLQLQVPMTEATCNNMADQVMDEIVHSKDFLYHSIGNVSPLATSSNII